MDQFTFTPAPWVPVKDPAVLERCRKAGPADYLNHPNKNLDIHIVPNTEAYWVADMFTRIKESDELDRKVVMITPNPCPSTYQTVAELINRFHVNCRNVYTFNMDEWADQDGNIAPESYNAGFNHSFLKYFYGKIDPALRMKRENLHAPTNENIDHYSDLICECGDGGADICYSGPGWAGHIAFIDPDTPEFACDSIDTFVDMKARIVTLNPMTIMQNSLHGCFGCSGDVANVPPKAATIGPFDVKHAKNRLETQAITTMGTLSSWQRMTSRLTLFGPVSMQCPTSIIQLWPTTVIVSESIAAPFGCWETVGY